ncbi:fructose bisphosphate aldolase [Erythrobacter sp. HL-111]|uniref:fructose bisphosphate aldolase n=1 Tax=Erythrobacter sp. HL-111 TaxID=1798193 RepID=UPI0006D99930|nr:fructose bisphosphate aldolase [Erythrobacter sp. HL-111]KPP90261.1 MAG: fructose-bisphosphate aldolase, class I AldO [Erythrobacteraceae bacterium HL-111]SDR86324.1 fructose-bisphosphate aldolase, class I [Erythrobacter sp. HL-111]
MNTDQMTARIATGAGFIAALDQSGGSTPKALRGYGVEDGEWSDEDEMFAAIHAMRARVITAPCFGEGKVLGAILFEKTMDGEVEGKPTGDALKSRGIVPFIKVDQGLADEADGVQLMKPLDKLPALLEKSVAKGMFGTKMRSVIKSANPAGIAAIVAQQFEVGNTILDAGLMPIIEPEYDINAEDRAGGEEILLAEILKQLDALPEGRQVMLKLSIPVKAGLYGGLVDHPGVLRVLALSGGYSTDEACEHLARNPGMIASFSRGLLQDLRKDQSDEEFNKALGEAIDKIAAASA